MGAPGQDVPGGLDSLTFDQGRAYLFSGTDGKLLRTLNDPVPGERAAFGSTVLGTEDVSGDGIPDLLVGARGQGLAFVFSGAAGGLLQALKRPTAKSNAEDVYGGEIVTLGDLSGDGIPDLVVKGQTSPGNMQGRQSETLVFLSRKAGDNISITRATLRKALPVLEIKGTVTPRQKRTRVALFSGGVKFQGPSCSGSQFSGARVQKAKKSTGTFSVTLPRKMAC